jgi:uncharacterized protein YqhQ
VADGGAPGLQAERDAPVGGQAILEGVMMRGVRTWAVAVRLPVPEAADPQAAPAPEPVLVAAGAPDAPVAEPTPALAALPDPAPLGEIQIKTFEMTSVLKRHRWLRIPILRGVVALGESLAIGFKALNISANAQLGEEDEEIGGGMWFGTVVVALILAIGLFFVVPVGLTSLIKGQLNSAFLFWVVEGIVRTAIFLGYLWVLSRVPDLRRVFEYHGAEHKTISCYEAGVELEPANAQRFSRLHPRCGTSFLLIVMVVAIFVFAPLGLLPWYWLVVTRIVGVPVIAGISFEIIKFAGKHRRKRWVQIVMAPGMALQKLTTREPDLDQLAVAIASLQAVLAVETPGSLSADDLVGNEVVA